MPFVRRLPALLFVAALLAPTAGAVAPKGGPRLAPHVPGELLVTWRDGVDVAERDAQMVRLGADIGGPIGRRGAQRLKLGQGADLRAAIARLKASGLVESASPNWIHRKLEACAAIAVPNLCPNDAEFAASHQYAAHDDEDNDMDLPQAWAVVSSTNGVLLAIADDGFRLTHEELSGDLQSGTSCAGNPCAGTAAAQAATRTMAPMSPAPPPRAATTASVSPVRRSTATCCPSASARCSPTTS